MVLAAPLLVALVAFGAVVSVAASVATRRLTESPPPLSAVGAAGLVAGTLFLLATLASTYFGLVPGPLSENLVVNAAVTSLPTGAVFSLLGFPRGTALRTRAVATVAFGSGCVVLLTGVLLAGQVL